MLGTTFSVDTVTEDTGYRTNIIKIINELKVPDSRPCKSSRGRFVSNILQHQAKTYTWKYHIF